MKRIAIEEHFWTEEIKDYLRSRKDYPKMEMVRDEKGNPVEQLSYSPTVKAALNPAMESKLVDLGEGRIKEMDQQGIDMQVVCLSTGIEVFEPAEGTMVAKMINNALAKAVNKHPDRLAGFAAIAPQDPQGAADELERAVKELGLKGAKVNSNVQGEYMDEEKYWVIFERAEKLGVPIYLHPKMPSQEIIKPFLKYPALTGSIWGYAADTGLHAMRLICSGVFDKYPGLKIILGHLGEALPLWQWRIDNRWQIEKVNSNPRSKKLAKLPGQYIADNFLVTTSGMFWHPALLMTYLALGADKILFAVDYPYESNKVAIEFMDTAPICNRDKEKIYHQNAEELLNL